MVKLLAGFCFTSLISILQGDCLTCNSGSPTKRLLQVTDMDSGRRIHVPAIFLCCYGTWPTREPPCRFQPFTFHPGFQTKRAAFQFWVDELQSISELSAVFISIFGQVSWFDLHARYIPRQQFEKLFQTSVCVCVGQCQVTFK